MVKEKDSKNTIGNPNENKKMGRPLDTNLILGVATDGLLLREATGGMGGCCRLFSNSCSPRPIWDFRTCKRGGVRDELHSRRPAVRILTAGLSPGTKKRQTNSDSLILVLYSG